jgi:Mrp family chromosome partitioning ATPase
VPGTALNGAGPDNGKVPGSGEGSLHVLGSGPIPPDVGEFVGTNALAEIIADLRERAEVVLVDAPPLLGLGDTRVLITRVDGVLLVARLSVLRRPMVKELERVLATSPAEMLGFVVTGAEQEDGYGSRSYYYRTREPEPAVEEREPVA